jgi:transcriptional regulator with XRE-family HTH domain
MVRPTGGKKHLESRFFPEIGVKMRRKEALDERAISIYALRSLRGWTQGELAEAMGTTAGTVSEYESGKRRISERAARRAAEVVGIPADRLMDLEAFLHELRGLMGGAPPPRRDSREMLAEELSLGFETIARRAVEGVLGRPWRTAGAPREPVPAAVLRAELDECGKEERRALVEEGVEYQTRDLCALLCAESRRSAEAGEDSALELAELALHVAERVPGDAEWRACVQAFAWAHLGHARRQRGDRTGAEEAFAQFRQLWQDGAPRRSLLLAETGIADLENLVSGPAGSPY